jgi:hypothetical protein
MATLGLSKVFILDKYFTELQKFWETEKKLQGESVITCSLYLKHTNFSKIKPTNVQYLVFYLPFLPAFPRHVSAFLLPFSTGVTLIT